MTVENEARPLVLIGVGSVATAVAGLTKGRRVVGTTRSSGREATLRDLGIEPVVVERLTPDIVESLVRGADVLVSFPPDGSTDAAVASACAVARSVVYISSTGVYGPIRGRIDDETTPRPESDSARTRLAAENIWRSVGAVVLRAPGIYGPTQGLHIRLKRGTYVLPGDGSGVISRIHVEDLARFVLAAFERAPRGRTYVVGDLAPLPQRDVVAWLADALDVPFPPSVPLEQVHPTLRGSREIDPSRAIAELGVTLRYPTYREGFAALL